MTTTPTTRKYAWGLQTNFLTPKTLSAGALKQMIVIDKNTIEYSPDIKDNGEWSTGYNSATEEWVEGHAASVLHTIPGHAEELGKPFSLSMANVITIPAGGTNSRTHTFTPTDPNVTRQDRAVTYAENLGAGWHKMMQGCVTDGFTLKGSEKGVLTCDFNLLGDGKIINNPSITYPPTATPTVTNLTNLYKFSNTMMNITPNDGGSYTSPYGCQYRSFEIAFKKTMLSDAGEKPGCKRFLVDNDPDSGLIKSAHEFDKQMLDFNFEVDMAAGTPEFEAVQDQRPIALLIQAIGKIIEGTIPFQLDINLHIAKYRSTKPVESQGMWRFGISGQSLFNVANNELFNIALTNTVASYATGW